MDSEEYKRALISCRYLIEKNSDLLLPICLRIGRLKKTEFVDEEHKLKTERKIKRLEREIASINCLIREKQKQLDKLLNQPPLKTNWSKMGF